MVHQFVYTVLILKVVVHVQNKPQKFISTLESLDVGDVKTKCGRFVVYF